jgi:hypothetical protein
MFTPTLVESEMEKRMADKLQYVVNEQGEQVGVLLDLAAYRRLTRQPASDSDLLSDLSQAELQALAESMLAPDAQARLNDLLARSQDTQLSEEENAELDRLLEQIDQLTILKTRAKYTLNGSNQVKEV